MLSLDMERWHDIVKDRWDRKPGIEAPSLFNPLLVCLSSLYGLGLKIRFYSYKSIKKQTLPGFVLSVGNLTVGGTGKTPATCMLARWASDEGYRVAVLSRGYGGRSQNKTLEVSDGKKILTGPEKTGDEPFLLAKSLPGIPVIVSKKRYKGGLLAHDKYNCDFYILDDGFQHVVIERDLDLVLMDASNPFGNERLLPYGPLREPVEHLNRADAFMLTRFSGQSSARKSMTRLKDNFPSKPVFWSDHIPQSVVLPNKNEVHDADFLKGKRVVAFAGIASPEKFKETIMNLGAEPVFFKAFGDHYPFQTLDILRLIKQKESLKADFILTTEKDWVRMTDALSEYPDLAYLTIKMAMLYEEDKFFQWIREKIESSQKKLSF
jgi:tetraacyldisaccharide 4'-kinase